VRNLRESARRVGALVGALLLVCGQLIWAPLAAFAVVLETDLIAGVPYPERGLMAEEMVDIDAPSAILVTRGGQVLWSRDAHVRRSIASITKVMTAILAIENGTLTDEAPISYEAATVGGSTANLVAGEAYPLRTLLDMMLLVSGNDAAVAIGEYLGGSGSDYLLGTSPEAGANTDPFITLMNTKAAELGMKDSHFNNPQGYDDEFHYSSAADVATMSAYAMTLPLFREIVASPGDPESPFQNTNELLRTFEGANGVKTGFTDNAGSCVAASALRDDIELYAVVLGSQSEESRFVEAAQLLSFGFDHYATRTLLEADMQLGSTEVKNYLDVTVPVGITDEVTATYFDLLGPVEQEITIEPVRAPVEVGTVVGFVTFTQNGEQIARAPIVSFEAVAKPGFFEAVSIALTRLWRTITGAGGSAALVTFRIQAA